MGLCASSDEHAGLAEAKGISKTVDEALVKDANQDRQVSKLLLLGAGASGKSTLFKQMELIYGTGISDDEKMSYITIIHINILNSLNVLMTESDNFPQVPVVNTELRRTLLEVCQLVERNQDVQIDDVLGGQVVEMWNDPGIQHTFANRGKYSLTDSTAYYFGRMDDIRKSDYLPNVQDVIRVRQPTTGILRKVFDIDGNKFEMYDVGGQRSERKKWINCFEGVTAVLFVAALSAYNQCLYEDESQNDLAESLILFEEISNSEWLQKSSIILFLNKRDIFYEKIVEKKIPLGDFFPEYEGNNTYEDGCEFVQDMFLRKNPEREIYTHITCATDEGNVLAVFNSVKDAIIQKGLANAGLLS
jgi:GTPase SAR1 family protein